MTVTTVDVAIVLAKILDGAPLAYASVTFEPTGPDVDGALIIAPPETVVCDENGTKVAKLWPNVDGVYGTQTRVTVYTKDGRKLMTALATVPDYDCNLHDIINIVAPPSVDDAQAAVDKARAWAIKLPDPVEGGEYSAKYHAQAAAIAATQTAEDRLATNADAAIAAGASSVAYGAMLTAIAQASLASIYALAAAAVVAQDLSGVTAAGLHRSPAVTTGEFDYDTSKDSDGGAWVDKVDGGYLSRTLNGAWIQQPAGVLRGIDTEALARSMGGALGPELMAAANNTTVGWTASNGAVLSVDARGRLVVTNGPSFNGGANFTIPVTVGVEYVLQTDMCGSTASAQNIRASFDGGGSFPLTTAAGGQSLTFRASSASLLVQVYHNSAGVGLASTWANFSLRTVTAYASSGSYYPNSLDGKFYRLWRNLLASADDLAVGSVWLRNNINNNVSGTVTGGQADPWGGNTAAKFVPTNAFFGAYLNNSGLVVPVLGQQHTMWGYVKADGFDFTSLALNTTGSPSFLDAVALFDLTGAGAVVSSSGADLVSASIAAVPGAAGWFVYSVIANTTTTIRTNISPIWRPYVNSTTLATGDGVKGTRHVRPVFEQGAFTATQIVSGLTSYESKVGVDTTKSETFDGNKRRFPRRAYFVYEASRVVVYDLLEPGRPMWMVCAAGPVGTTKLSWISASPLITAGWAREGWLAVGCGNAGCVLFNFAKDDTQLASNTGLTFQKRSIVDRNTSGAVVAGGGYIIAGTFVSAVSMTTMPDAPVDSASGLKTPTIAVGTTAGSSIIQNDGTVVTPGGGAPASGIVINPYIALYERASTGATYYVLQPGKATTGVAWSSAISGGANAPDFGSGTVVPSAKPAIAGRGTVGGIRSAVQGAPALQFLRLNEMSVSASLAARAGPTYHTGGLWGDIRRCILSEVTSGPAVDASVVVDRSYKAKNAAVVGTLQRTAVAPGAQLVAYGGFGAANYIREAYSADLDFGTTGLNVSSWWLVATGALASVTPAPGGVGSGAILSYLPLAGFPAVAIPLTMNTADWTKGAGWAASAGGTVTCDGTQPGSTDLAWTAGANRVLPGSNAVVRRWSIVVAAISGTLQVYPYHGIPFTITAPGTYSGLGGNWSGSGSQIFRMLAAGQTCSLTVTLDDLQPAWATDRSAAAGAYWRKGINAVGCVVGEMYDGTNPARVVASNSGYVGVTVAPELSLLPSGTLALKLAGEQVSAAQGVPLLTLNNATAVLTVGNSRTLDAAFPGSIALVRIGATVPTAYGSRAAWQLERAMFRDGAQVTLPDATALTDLDYDDSRDVWTVTSTANASEFVGFVRTTVTPSPGGTYNHVTGRAGVRGLSRITTNPGVDVFVPSQNLKEELLSTGEEAATARAKLDEPYDWAGGFTGTLTNGTNTITAVAGMSLPLNGSLRGAQVSHANLPAGTVVLDQVGTTLYLSANATAGVVGASIVFLDFILPQGMEARDVFAGTMGLATLRQEGASKEYTRPFDGFCERARFTTGPGAAAHVRINGRRFVYVG